MDRFLARMASKTVLSPPAASHKRAADTVVVDHADTPTKKARAATDDSNSLPHFPSHSSAWQPAAQSFYDSLPHSHRSPFVDLVNNVLECNNQLTSSTSLSLPLVTVSPPPAIPSPVVAFDPSTALLSFLDLSFVQPRGKFDVHITNKALVLTSSGKQPSTIVLPFTSLGQLAAVPDVNRKDRCVLLSLRPTAEPLPFDDTKALRLAHQTTQPTNTAVSEYFLTTLSHHCPHIRPVVPHRDTFESGMSSPSISCYYGTNDGHLYPLPTGLLFIQRPVVWVALECVDGIEVRRSGGGKCFDLKVGVKRSGEKEEVVVFGMIGVNEQQALERYVHYVAKWQKKQENQQKTNAALNSGTAVTDSTAATSSQQVEASDEPAAEQDDSDSEADSDFDPDGGSDEEGGGDASGEGSGSDGGGSDSDDSQFNSDIDVEAEVSADEEAVKETTRRTRTAQPTKQRQNSQPSKLVDSDNSDDESEDESEDEQPTRTAIGEKRHDENMGSSETDEEVPQEKTKQYEDDAGGDMSRFRNVSAADTSKEELDSSASSAKDGEVITID